MAEVEWSEEIGPLQFCWQLGLYTVDWWFILLPKKYGWSEDLYVTDVISATQEPRQIQSYTNTWVCTAVSTKTSSYTRIDIISIVNMTGCCGAFDDSLVAADEWPTSYTVDRNIIFWFSRWRMTHVDSWGRRTRWRPRTAVDVPVWHRRPAVGRP